MSQKKQSNSCTITDLSPRQRNLLFSVIKEYCDTGESVGSKEIKEKYAFDFSPATIRNEFAALREMGFLYQAFTNASSKPTEKAFKLFINQLIAGLQITNKQHLDLKKKILELEEQQLNLNKEISRLLAFQGGGVGFSVNQETENFTGISNLLSSGSENQTTEILEFLDNIDKYKQPLLESKSQDSDGTKKRLQTVFGSENPVLPLGKGYALVASEIYVNGERSVVGLIAPTHLLARKKNLELVNTLSKILEK